MQPPEDKVQLTDEDIATVRKCRQMSFWRGSVPFSIGSILSVALAQNYGFFHNRPKLRIPSYILATLVGYLVGKFSYLGSCRRMFLELDDSRIKDYFLGVGDAPMGRARSPVILNTPIDSNWQGERDRPLTYAERRELYGQLPGPNVPANDQSLLPDSSIQDESVPPSEQKQSYFSSDRPLGSYQFDDVYKPRD